MSITYRVDHELNVIFETWTGEVSTGELEEHWVGFLADREVLECRRTVADLRNCTISFFGADLDALIVKHVMPVLEGRTWRTALVVAQPLQFGVARQYQVFADKYSADQIFADIETATAWVRRELPG